MKVIDFRTFSRKVENKILIAVLFSLVTSVTASTGFAYGCKADQRLHVKLATKEHRIEAKADIRVSGADRSGIRFSIDKNADIEKVLVDGDAVDFEFADGIFAVPVEKSGPGLVELNVSYEAVFDDPAPVLPVNTDNPGYGVTGTIGEDGVFLLSGAGWHPVLEGCDSSYLLEVEAPAGMIAVTAGEYLGFETEGGRTISRWRIDEPVEGLSLSAAEYRVTRKRAGKVDVMTFFLPESADLAPSYLDAAEKYIADYGSLFGPYPFAKFAVVENFFPTGYGFPSYTLMGTRVLRLPFIVDTSLGHEIVHCWWGNGVLPDYRGGNWSEGLAAYTADYLFKERRSLVEAREYRLQMLRNYATLIGPSNDFALAGFMGRVDPATKVVGYDKAAMVFHMLRKKVGDSVFWEGLRTMYSRYLFKRASWGDFQKVYEKLHGKPLDRFFDQWINRKGAPALSLEDVTAVETDKGFLVKATLVQEPPFYDLEVGLEAKAGNSRVAGKVSIDGRSASFAMETDAFPSVLTVDPAIDVFRKLYPTEIPPAVNSLKASEFMVVVADGGRFDCGGAASLLMRALGVENFKIVERKDCDGGSMPPADVLWIGAPPANSCFSSVSGVVAFKPGSFELNGVLYDKPGDVFFGVFPHPEFSGRAVGLLLSPAGGGCEAVARKIPHYGKYSYLAFENGRNREKGTWPVEDSPLIHRFDPAGSLKR